MDWTFSQVAWSSLGLLVAGAGLALLIRGGVRWRTQGEKPCTCGYDLAHSPINGGTVQCAECGVKVPVARIVAKHPRRWKLVLAGVTLLLLGEPVWRVQHVTDATGAKNWMAIVPTWVLAGVWPVPKPVADGDDINLLKTPRLRRIASKGYGEFDRRMQQSSLASQRGNCWASLYGRRMGWAWNGGTVKPLTMWEESSEPAILRFRRINRVFSDPRRDGERWSDSVRQFARIKFPGNEHDIALPARLAATWEEEAFEIVWGKSLLPDRLAMIVPNYVREGFVSVESWGDALVMVSIDQLDDRLASAWDTLNDFYAVAGPDDRERLLTTRDATELRAFWVGDVCERPNSATTTRGLPALEFVGEFNHWLATRRIYEGQVRSGAVDPTGQILLLDGDARSHELMREFFVYLRETQSHTQTK